MNHSGEAILNDGARVPSWNASIAAIYDDYFPDWASTAPVLFEFLRRRGAPADSVVLDLFCGTGGLMCAFAGMGWSGVGVDASSPMLEVANKKAQSLGADVEFIRRTVQAYEAPSGQFDVVSATGDAVNHLLTSRDLVALFERAGTALQPGGLLIFDCLTARGMDALSGQYPLEDDRGRLDRQLLYNAELRLLLARVEGVLDVDGTTVTVQHAIAERSYPIAQIVALLEGSSFGSVDVCAVPSLETIDPLDFEEQRSVMVVARKEAR